MPQPHPHRLARRSLLAALAVASLVHPLHAAAQAFPGKPVRVIIPGGAGTGPDTLTRILTGKLAELWGQPVVAENVVGAGGNIGHERVAKAPADGYTLLLGMIGPMAINPSLQEGKLGFDPVKDLQPVTMVVRYPNLLVVHPAVPAKSLQELLAYAKANPGKLRYGTPGSGTTPHLSAVMLSQMAGVQMLEVPYKSSAQMTTDVLAGHIDLMFLNPGAILQHVKSGAVRALAITSTSRQPYAPDVPTMAEAGLPGYEVSSWFGVFAPAGTPPAVVSRINADLVKVMNQPDVQQQFATRGDEPFFGTPEQASAYLRAEIAKWNRLIKEANIKAD
ncbi:MAG TPA: tripartite tricarboxylate transporter substrate binding protein [Ramlibacter sp.]|nr:tripartite tricarboxylate transporter substrate binding protein [Ramlibacter sp.]